MILLDLDMPIMNGYQACQMIRGDSYGGTGQGIKSLLHIDKDHFLPFEEQKEVDVKIIAQMTLKTQPILILAITAFVDE